MAIGCFFFSVGPALGNFHGESFFWWLEIRFGMDQRCSGVNVSMVRSGLYAAGVVEEASVSGYKLF